MIQTTKNDTIKTYKATYYGNPFTGGYGSGNEDIYTESEIIEFWGAGLLEEIQDGIAENGSYTFRANNWTRLFKINS